MKINSTLQERLHEKGYTTYSNEIFRKYYTDDIHQIIRVEDNEIFDYWIKCFNFSFCKNKHIFKHLCVFCF